MVEIGKFGFWQRAVDYTTDMAVEAERMGYHALWVGGSPAGNLEAVEALIAATEEIPVITGIVNMWREDSDLIAASFHRIEARYPGRFLLGLGIGHPESVQEYHHPYQSMVDYLDRLSASGVPQERMVLAALGPRVLRLSADRAAGAHPYLTSPVHSRLAREIVGTAHLAPAQKLLLDTDSQRARTAARENVARYLQLANYRNNMLREGWTHEDIDGGGSDRLIDSLVLNGTVDEVADGLRAHMIAGANHVCVEVLGSSRMADYERLASALLV